MPETAIVPMPWPCSSLIVTVPTSSEVMALKEDRISYLNAEPTRDGAERSETEPPLAQEVAEVHSAEADDAVIEEADFRHASDKMDSFDRRLRSKTSGGQEQADPT